MMEEIFKYANLTREERDMYNTSLKYKWDNKNVRDYEVNKGREEGRSEGREEGVAIGEHKKAIAMALKLREKGMPVEEIVELTDLSIEEIAML